MNKTLIVGANGTIGSAIADEFTARNIDFDGTFSSNFQKGYLHLNLLEDLSKNDFSRYSKVIICAGVAGKSAEQNQDIARLINIDGTVKLIDKIHELGGTITFISSSAVFSSEQQSSNENNTPNPQTIYGKQKREIEEYLLHPSLNKFNPTIIRPTKVLSGNRGLIKTWLEEKTFTTNKAVKLSPISDKFLAKVITNIQIEKKCGVFHVSGLEILDFEQFAEKLILRTNMVPKNRKRFEDFSQSPNSAYHLTTTHNISKLILMQSLEDFFFDTLSGTLGT